jgi:hypothetical protein
MKTHISLKDEQIDDTERYAQKAPDLDKSSGKELEMKDPSPQRKKNTFHQSTHSSALGTYRGTHIWELDSSSQSIIRKGKNQCKQ